MPERVVIGSLGIACTLSDERADVRLSFQLETAAQRQRNVRGPMLAKRWHEGLRLPMLVQPKLNGWRILADKDGLWSRGGGRIGTLPHIAAALAPLFATHPTLTLDGEAYAHGAPLAQIAGSIMRHEPGPDSTAICFHVFDYIAPEPYRIRAERLHAIVPTGSDSVTLLPAVACSNRRDLDDHYRQSLADGYEGQMLRDPDAPYVRGRTDALLKRKPIHDAADILAA